ncbi:hypothetical protein BB559_001430 [Furculomyces boomerangus]|uniref:AB hydrolase-1 domain-containing protein n=2 Tax=Harpellales TaxID=61421 RepID=A0A2T9Z220_9FUNG|nr:hypothetical protein BB559_001430 [Furculomyces boomerangus]
MPGSLVYVVAVGTTSKYGLHVYCSGLKQNRPTFVLLSDFGYPGVSMKDLVNSISDLGYGACVIDRPGYGWSEPGYFPQKPSNVVDEINQALENYPVPKPYIMIGWGDGGLYSQLYIQKFQVSVYGVALLNVYPNKDILQTFAYNNTAVLQNIQQLVVSSNQFVYFDKTEETYTSRYYESWRAFTPFGYIRSLAQFWSNEISSSTNDLIKALTRNNFYYQACYFEYGFTGKRAYQELLTYVTGATNSILQLHSWPLRWPSFPVTGTYGFGTVSKRQDSSSNPVTLVTTTNSTLVSFVNTTTSVTTAIPGTGSSGTLGNTDWSSGTSSGSSSGTQGSSSGSSSGTQGSSSGSSSGTQGSNTGSSSGTQGSNSGSGTNNQSGSKDISNNSSSANTSSGNFSLSNGAVGLSPSPLSLAPVPLLIMIDSNSINGDCKTFGITGSTECQKHQALAWFRYRQQVEYYQTLSSKSFFVVCSGPVAEDNKICGSDFVLTRPKWLASQLVAYFFPN